MANTITFEMTETQAQKFEKMLDDTLEILNRMEKESPERDARFDRMYEETQQKFTEIERLMKQTDQRMEKWGIGLEK